MKEFNGTPQEIGEEISRAIPPKLQEAFARVVKAGMKVMFSEQTHQMMMEQLSADGEMDQVLGEGIAGLMLLLFQKSNQTMPPEVIVPAGIYLLSEAADFTEKIMKEKVPAEIMASSISVMTNIILEKMGVPKDKMDAAMNKAAQGGYQ
ncbi:MAG TPA: hypothetical protein VES38_06900 [Methylotenera sp.]|nr:hypothetical protein [Methylotenera sp.]